MKHVFLMLLLSCTLHADPSATANAAQAPEKTDPAAPPAAEATPSITRLEDGRMKIGEVTFDPKTRQVRVPCTINMSEGLIEFAVVHENGKIHESLLVTKCSPTHINIAFKLLRYVSSEELYAIEKERGVSSDKYPEVPEATRKAARVDLKVEWEKDGKTQTVPLADWIMHAETTEAMSQDPWVYGGSMMYDGAFVAEQTGDVASIMVSRGSLLLYAGQNNFNDDVWLPHTKRVPPVGTVVNFLIQPHKP
jgi:hypothetical protein